MISGTAKPNIPSGAPNWVTEELLHETVRIWQPFYADPLSPSDALSILLSFDELLDAVELIEQG